MTVMKDIHMTLPDPIICALDVLERSGHEGWLVGGCVRDAVMGIVPHDYDITTSAMPEETLEAFSSFRTIPTGIKHGTVTVLIDGEPVEITTYRVESEYLDNRHPSSISFAGHIEDDLKRRDFTINAMAFHPRNGLLDLYGGQADIENKVIRCVGNADERFTEDGLRILRALRFASRLGFSLDKSTGDAVRAQAHLLSRISAERLFDELCGILCGNHAGEIIKNYPEVISVVIPEIEAMIDFEQNSKYHCYDLLEHTCAAINGAANDRIVRLALFLHDIGKPSVRFTGDDGYDHYFGHQEKSAQMADEILRRLKADGNTRRTVVKLIGMHDRHIKADRKWAKKLLRELTLEEARMLMQVKVGDAIAHADGYNDPSEIYKTIEVIEAVAADNECFSLGDLAVNGRDIISLGVQPGPEVGDILEALLDGVINAEVENERERLIEKAESIIKVINGGKR